MEYIMPYNSPLRKESANFRHPSTIFRNSVYGKLFITAVLVLIPFSYSSPQNAEKKQAPTYDENHPERKVSTYLDVHHAVKNINSLKSQVMLDIYRLNKIINNFNGQIQGADADYKNIKDNYKKGIDLYYRREYLESSYVLKDTRKMSQNLYKKFSEHFQKQIGDLLNSCSESMVNIELKNIPGDSSSSISLDTIRHNQFRLRIAYNQVYLADQMTRDDRYDAAIDHLRLAKLYAINVLKNLEMDETKKAAMDKQYEADIIDAMGGVVGTANSGNPS